MLAALTVGPGHNTGPELGSVVVRALLEQRPLSVTLQEGWGQQRGTCCLPGFVPPSLPCSPSSFPVGMAPWLQALRRLWG